MKRAPEQPAALEKREQPGKLRAIILALFVHALFFGFIIFGVTWQSSPTPPVEAELWDKLPPVAAKPPPRPQPPPPEPPKPEPPKPEPPKPEPPKPDPEIALKAEREKREREKKKAEEAKKKAEEVRKKEDDARKKREELEAAKKREQEEDAKKKREQEKRRREEEIAKREAEKARAAQLEARQKEFNEYVSRIRAKIKSRANVPDSVTGKPTVQVQIRILPGGEVLDIRVIKPSGNRAYDSAIERAIRSASPLPVPDVNSELFPQFREPILNFEHER